MGQQKLFAIVDGNIKTGLKCTACALCENPNLATNCMSGYGPKSPDFMFLGFGPGIEDDREGRPMVGDFGAMFWKLLNEAGIPKSSVYVSNLIKCYPNRTKLTDRHFKACSSHLVKELEEIKPRCIVALGYQACGWLTGIKGLKGLSRRGIPCKFGPQMVYSLKHPGLVLRQQGEARTTLREQLKFDLVWLREKAFNNKLDEADEVKTDYRIARSLKDVEDFVTELQAYDKLACDIETNMDFFPEEGNKLVAIGFSGKKGQGRAIPLIAVGSQTLQYWEDGHLDRVKELVRPLLSKTLFGHNFVQFDQKGIKWFWGLGDGLNIDFDTMYAHYLLDETIGMQNLEQIAMNYTSMPPWKHSFQLEDTEKLCHYLCMDVDATWRIREVLETELNEAQTNILHNTMLPVGKELCDVESRGISVSRDNLVNLSSLLSTRLAEEEQRLRKVPEIQAFEFNNNIAFNMRSTHHIRSVINEYLHLNVTDLTETGLTATGADALEKFKDNHFVNPILQIRGLTKLKSTYVDGILEVIKKDGRVHTSYPVTATVTARLASRDPNLQNIAGDDKVERVLDDGSVIKSIFCAKDKNHSLVQLDYSQIELRVLASESNDENLVQTFKQGLDPHSATAAFAFDKPIEKVTKSERRDAKIVNFGLVYGKGDLALQADFIEAAKKEALEAGVKFTAKDVSMASQRALEFKALHQKSYPGVWAWLYLQGEIVRTLGYQETRFGRRRRYSEGVDDRAIRQAQNFPIQSISADILFESIKITKKILTRFDMSAKLVLTVHDSLIFEVYNDNLIAEVTAIKHVMENLSFPWLKVPLKVDVEYGSDWGKMQKLEMGS